MSDAQTKARIAELEQWIHDAIVRGRIATDKALNEFGYTSIRFADVRYGWHETIGDMDKVPIPFPKENK